MRTLAACWLSFLCLVLTLPARGEDVPIARRGGVYYVPVQINGVLTLDFVIDSGAAHVNLPSDVASTLVRTGTIREEDFLPGTTYVLADGREVKSSNVMLRSLQVGNVRIQNVRASIDNQKSSLLLGQSLLERLGRYSIDPQGLVLVIEDRPAGGGGSSHEANSLNEAGLKLSESGHDREAVEKFSQAIQLNPNEPNFFYNRGVAYRNLSDFEKALVDFSRALELNPTDADFLWRRGDVLDELGQTRKAYEDYTACLKLNPKHGDAYAFRGVTLENEGQLALAVADYTQALKLGTTSMPKDEVYYHRSSAHYGLEEYPEALLDLNRAIELSQTHPSYYFRRGDTHDELGHYQEALADYDAAIKLRPDAYSYWEYRAFTLVHLKRLEEAIQNFDEAVRLSPDNPNLLFFRGDTRRKLGQNDLARRDFEAALKLSKPGTAVNAALVKALKELP